MHKDILGNYINVGDGVVYCTPSTNLRKGVVASITPKMIRMVDGRLVWPYNCILPGRLPV